MTFASALKAVAKLRAKLKESGKVGVRLERAHMVELLSEYFPEAVRPGDALMKEGAPCRRTVTRFF